MLLARQKEHLVEKALGLETMRHRVECLHFMNELKV